MIAMTDQSAAAYTYLLAALSQADTPACIGDLLAAILTESEQIEIANRLLIFAQLQQGLPQREISERLGVGIATVSRGAKAYQRHAVATLLPDLADALPTH